MKTNYKDKSMKKYHNKFDGVTCPFCNGEVYPTQIYTAKGKKKESYECIDCGKEFIANYILKDMGEIEDDWS